MSQQELLRRTVEALDAAGIPYIVTGSVASSLQGEPRLSHDVDFVIQLGPEGVAPLLNAFPPPAYYLSESAVREAVQRRWMFNLLAPSTGDKVDFWLFTDSPFDRSRFHRRVRESVLGVSLFMSSPEDTILAKLNWAREAGGSEKQMADARSVYEVQGPRLDRTYLDEWAAQLGVTDLWQQVQREAEPL